MREVFLVASLVDTNILVYRCDPRDPDKREAALETLRAGEMSGELRIPHQALVEFVNSVTRPRGREAAIMKLEDATRQAELFVEQFPVLYPNEKVFRIALLGMAAYKFSWYDAHLWAYAEHYGLPELLSEDFEHGRKYGSVRVRNPFLAAGLG
jgi:predicted nucleic acid-binding protein